MSRGIEESSVEQRLSRTCEIYFERLGMHAKCRALSREEIGEVSQMRGERAQRYALFLSCEELRKMGEQMKEEGKIVLPFDVTETLNPADVAAAYDEICRMSGWDAQAQITVKRNYDGAVAQGEDDVPDTSEYESTSYTKESENKVRETVQTTANDASEDTGGIYTSGESQKEHIVRDGVSEQAATYTDRAKSLAHTANKGESTRETTEADTDMDALCEYLIRRVLAAAENM